MDAGGWGVQASVGYGGGRLRSRGLCVRCLGGPGGGSGEHATCRCPSSPGSASSSRCVCAQAVARGAMRVSARACLWRRRVSRDLWHATPAVTLRAKLFAPNRAVRHAYTHEPLHVFTLTLSKGLHFALSLCFHAACAYPRCTARTGGLCQHRLARWPLCPTAGP